MDVYPFEVFEGSIAVFEGSIAVIEGSIAVFEGSIAVFEGSTYCPALTSFFLTFPPSLLRPLGAVERQSRQRHVEGQGFRV